MFSALVDHGDCDDAEDNLEQTVRDLKSWAHNVKVIKPKKTISNVKELDQFRAENPDTAKLPANRTHLERVMRMVTSKVQCGKDEVLVLMDSGSTINTAGIAAHFFAYENSDNCLREGPPQPWEVHCA